MQMRVFNINYNNNLNKGEIKVFINLIFEILCLKIFQINKFLKDNLKFGK